MGAATTDELLILIRQAGSEQAAAGVRQVKVAVAEAGAAGSTAAGGIQQMEHSLGNLAMMVTGAVGSLGMLVAGLSSFLGIGQAAKYRAISLGLEQVTGSVSKAAELMRGLKDLGAETPFDTGELASFAQDLIGAGTAIDQVVPKLKALADLLAFNNVPRGMFQEVMRDVTGMLGRPTLDREQAEMIAHNLHQLPKILNAGLGLRPGTISTTGEAINRMTQLGGPKSFDALIKGSEIVARNSAKMAAYLNPLNAVGNIIENIANIMEPTGRVLLVPLMALARGLQDISQLLGKFNDWSRGIAGLLFLVGLVIRSWTFLTAVTAAAKAKIDELTAAISRLAAAAGVASSSANAASARSAMSFGAKAVAAAKTPGGASAIGFGVDIGGNMLGDAIGGTPGKYVSNISSGIGTGLQMAAIASMFAPELAPLFMALAVVGGIIYGITKTLSEIKASEGESLGRKIDETNRLLGGIDGKMYGGGRRARGADTQMQLERQLAQMAAAGLG